MLTPTLYNNKSGVKRRNTLGHLDQYTAPNGKLTVRQGPHPPQIAFTCHVVDDLIRENNKKLYKNICWNLFPHDTQYKKPIIVRINACRSIATRIILFPGGRIFYVPWH